MTPLSGTTAAIEATAPSVFRSHRPVPSPPLTGGALVPPIAVEKIDRATLPNEASRVKVRKGLEERMHDALQEETQHTFTVEQECNRLAN